MSRRSHHGRSAHGRPRPHKNDHHRPNGSAGAGARGTQAPRPVIEATPPDTVATPPGPIISPPAPIVEPPPAIPDAPTMGQIEQHASPEVKAMDPPPPAPVVTSPGPAISTPTQPGTNGAPGANGALGSNGIDRAPCTAPQLRRFIKSRPWIPLHELRRRFAINGSEDDVTAVEVDGHTVFVGLPSHEGRLLGELLRGGEIGYELSLDPGAPIVIGVYPMRPVPRP